MSESEGGSIFEEVFNTLLTDVLSPVLLIWGKAVWGIVKDIFLTFAGIVWYYIYTAILKVIDFMEDAFTILAGMSAVTYKNQEMSLLEAMLQFDAIRTTFLAITAISIGLALIFTMYKSATSISDMALENKNPISKVLGNGLKSALMFALIPFMCLFLVQLSSVLLNGVDAAMTQSTGKESPSMGTVIFLATTLDAADYDYEGYNYSNNSNVGFHDELREPYFNGTKSIYDLATVQNDFDLVDIDYILGSIVSVFVICVLIGACLIFIRRAFEIIVLYIVAPLFVSTMPLDDGALFKKWKDLFITKFFAAFGTVISMKLILMIIPNLLCGEIYFTDYPGLNKIVVLFMVCGGVLAAFKSQHLLTQILNEEEASRETETMALFVNKARQLGQKGAQAGMAVATGGGSAAATAASKGATAAMQGGQKFKAMAGDAMKSYQNSSQRKRKDE